MIKELLANLFGKRTKCRNGHTPTFAGQSTVQFSRKGEYNFKIKDITIDCRRAFCKDCGKISSFLIFNEQEMSQLIDQIKEGKKFIITDYPDTKF